MRKEKGGEGGQGRRREEEGGEGGGGRRREEKEEKVSLRAPFHLHGRRDDRFGENVLGSKIVTTGLRND